MAGKLPHARFLDQAARTSTQHLHLQLTVDPKKPTIFNKSCEEPIPTEQPSPWASLELRAPSQ